MLILITATQDQQRNSFFIVVPCILISSKSFVYQQMHFISVLENIKIYIKTYIKIAPTCFGLRPSSQSSHMSLAKVTFIISVKARRYGLCGCVAACCQSEVAARPWTLFKRLLTLHLEIHDLYQWL
jgi:hypothetical protein